MANLIAQLADGLENVYDAISNIDADPATLRRLQAELTALEVQKYILGFDIPVLPVTTSTGSGATNGTSKLV